MFKIECDLSAIENIEQVSIRKIYLGMFKLANDVVNDLKRQTPSGVSHFLQKSITMLPVSIDISNFQKPLTIYIGAPGVKYALPFFFGSKPHFPPYLALVDWVKLRGFGRGLAKRIESRAFILAKIIARRGTKSHSYILEDIIAKYKEKAGSYIKI